MNEAKVAAYGRFAFGTHPKSYGDLAFVEPMIAALNSKGRMVTVLLQNYSTELANPRH